MGKQNEDPRKKLDEPAEEQQLEQHNSVDENSKETAQVIEDEKLEEEKRESEKNMNDSAEKKDTRQQLEDRDVGKVTNKDQNILNK